MIKNWSYSKLLDFEACPYKAKLKHIDHVPEARSEAADRGTAIHQLAEDYVCGKTDQFPHELNKFKDDFTALRSRYDAQQVSLEGEWGFNSNWLPCDYRGSDIWLRVKADAVVNLTPSHALVIDYKTGKRFGNELKHGEQVQLYALGAAIRNPDLQRIDVELWYLDIDDLHTASYKREQVIKYLPSFEKRGLRVTTATKFPARPNEHNCKWCAYGPAKGGQCEFGVHPGANTVASYRKKFG